MHVQKGNWRVYSLLILALSFTIFLNSEYRRQLLDWQHKASAYDTKYPYIISNIAQAWQSMLIDTGFDTSSLPYRLGDIVNHHSYVRGIKHIPAGDGERLIWKGKRYLNPFMGEGITYPIDKMDNINEIAATAAEIAIKLPGMQAQNRWMHTAGKVQMLAASLGVYLNLTLQNTSLFDIDKAKRMLSHAVKFIKENPLTAQIDREYRSHYTMYSVVTVLLGAVVAAIQNGNSSPIACEDQSNKDYIFALYFVRNRLGAYVSQNRRTTELLNNSIVKDTSKRLVGACPPIPQKSTLK